MKRTKVEAICGLETSLHLPIVVLNVSLSEGVLAVELTVNLDKRDQFVGHAGKLKYADVIHRPPLRRRVLDGDRIMVQVAERLSTLQRLHLNAHQDVLEYELD